MNNEKTNKIKSHIQISKCQLSGFTIKDEKGKIYCYDIQTNTISVKDIKSINIEEGYFLPQVETALSQQVEVHFGQIRDTLNKNIRNKKGFDKFTFDNITHEKMMLFIKYSYLRSESLVSTFRKVYPICSKIRNLQDVIIYMGTQTHDIDIEKDLCGYNSLPIYNDTSKNFIVSKACFYTADVNDFNGQIFRHKWYVVPISSKCALIMIHNDDMANLPNYSFRHKISDESLVEYLNISCIQSEAENGNHLIFAATRETIEQVKSYINAHKNELNNLYMRKQIEYSINPPMKRDFVEEQIKFILDFSAKNRNATD